MDVYTITDDQGWLALCNARHQAMRDGTSLSVTPHAPKGRRSMTQNASLHLWLDRVASCLNDAGYDMKAVIKEDVDIDWTKDSVKTYLWKPVEKAMYGHESTTEANKTQYGDIEETLRRHMGAKFGVVLPAWPAEEKV